MRNTDALRRVCSECGVDSIYEHASMQWHRVDKLRIYPGAAEPGSEIVENAPAAAGAVGTLTVIAEHTAGGVVLDGCKRLAALQKAGTAEAPCLVVDRGLDARQRLLVRIMLNQGREFSCAEKIALMQQLNTIDIPPASADEIAGVIAAHDKEAGLLKQAIGLDEKTLESIRRGKFSLQTVPLFAALAQRQRHVIIDTFASFKLSLQIQRELLQWLPEIAYAHRCSVATLCNNRAVIAVCHDDTLNAPQKIARIKAHFHSLRYPRLDRAQQQWNRTAAQYTPDTSRVRFTHPPAFEKDGCTVTVTLRSGDDAPALFARLAEIERGVWNELVSPCSCSDAASQQVSRTKPLNSGHRQ